MSFQHQGFEAVTGIEPERALNIGVGAVQAPLWAAFYASAGLGAAWWWSTAWTRAVPTFDFAQLLAPEPQPAVEAYIEALDDAVCDMIEAGEGEAEEAVEAVEAEIAPAAETTVESVSDAVEQVEAAIAETTDVAPEAPTALEAAAEPVALEAADVAPETVVAEPVAPTVAADKPSFKPSKKKSPQAE